MHVGFVGTGNMGRPMATNLLVKGKHELTVFDLSAEATAPLDALGAARARDLPALARAARVTLLSLPDARAVEALEREYVASRAQLEGDLRELLGTLRAKGLVEFDDD